MGIFTGILVLLIWSTEFLTVWCTNVRYNLTALIQRWTRRFRNTGSTWKTVVVQQAKYKWMNAAQSYFTASKCDWTSLLKQFYGWILNKHMTSAGHLKGLLTFNKHLQYHFCTAGRGNWISTCFAVSCFISFLFSFSFLYAEWVTPRRFHCRVNQAETPIHQTGMCVLSLLTEGIQRGEETASELF